MLLKILVILSAIFLCNSFLLKPLRVNSLVYKKSVILNSVLEINDEGGDLEENPKTHGYEGDFKEGDIVKVAIHTKIYSVKKYSKEGFDPYGFVGKVHSLALYGRKNKTLCSAITPVKVEFMDGPGIPQNMFERKFIVHFAGDELELIERPPPEPTGS